MYQINTYIHLELILCQLHLQKMHLKNKLKRKKCDNFNRECIEQNPASIPD